ncbi:hypothetical protein DFH27DRAFT_603151 [Peziza echinospora]|nr:hypothetical protein DFH27DRAFT_603151 [Peziza echinospora]
MPKKNGKPADGKATKNGGQSGSIAASNAQNENEPAPSEMDSDTSSATVLTDFLDVLKTSLATLADYTTSIQKLPTQLEIIEEQFLDCQRVLAKSREQSNLLSQKDKEIEEWKNTATKIKDMFKEDLDVCRLQVQHAQRDNDEANVKLAALQAAMEQLKQNHDDDTLRIARKYDAEVHSRSVQNADEIAKTQEEHRKALSEYEAYVERLKAELAKERHASTLHKLKQDALEMEKAALTEEVRELREAYEEERDSKSETFRANATGQQFPRPLNAVIPFSNSTTSKALRTIWVMSRISHALGNYIFRPFATYLGSADQEENMRLIKLSQKLNAFDIDETHMEAIWRNLTLLAMSESGEFGQHLMTDPFKNERDSGREELMKDELDRIWPVLNASTSERKAIEVDLFGLVNRALKLWVLARRNVEKVEADSVLEWSPASDWDYLATSSSASSFNNREGHGDADGMLIDDNAIETTSTVSTCDDDSVSRFSESRKVLLQIFPKFSRPVQGTGFIGGQRIVLSEGVALFEGSPLIAQGEKEVNDIRLRELQERNHHHRRVSGTGKLRRTSGAGIAAAISRTQRHMPRSGAVNSTDTIAESVAILHTFDMNAAMRPDINTQATKGLLEPYGNRASEHDVADAASDHNPTPTVLSPAKSTATPVRSSRRVSIASSTTSVLALQRQQAASPSQSPTSNEEHASDHSAGQGQEE